MNNLTPTESNLTHPDTTDENEPSPVEATDETGPTRLDRRGILQFGGAAALAGAAAAVMSTKVAGAATTPGVMHYGASNDAGTATTGLTSANAKSALSVKSTGLGSGIIADATSATGRGYGVLGTGDRGAGVAGGTRGDGPGVRAYAEPGAGGSALEALTLEGGNASPTISAHQIGTGAGVFSHIENAANPSHAVYGRTIGVGNAVLGLVLNTESPAAAVKASTSGSGPGLAASSAKGVGGSFAGKAAQVQLVPSAEWSHPASGAPGQLFVDRAKRLWFCRGGRDWHQIA
ncbi:MAG TPA: hypothetical protein VL769_08100 [Acidimicrobiia bacterium]|nr:hypothetical protein [Acidimicrobiia bacterium]